MFADSLRRDPKALIVFTTGAVVFIVALDSALLNVAFPAMMTSFPGVSAGRLGWVISAYSLTLAVLLLPAGYFADWLGRKRLVNAGLAVFCLGAMGCAVSATPTQAIVSRCLQALGGAFALPASLGILLASFNGHSRAPAVGKWSSAGGLATAIGPVAGAALLHLVSWRALFWIHLPFGALVICASTKFLDDSRGQAGSPRVAVGVALAALGIGCLIAVCTGNSAYLSFHTQNACGAGFGILLIAAGGYLALGEPHFRKDFGTFVGTCTSLATLCFGAIFGAMLVGYDFALVYRFGFSFSRAGLLLAPIAMLSVPAARASGRLQKGASSFPILFAGACALLSAALLFFRLVRSPQFLAGSWLGITVFSAAGTGLCFPALTVQAMRGISPGFFALGSGLNQALRHIGTGLGVAVLTSFSLRGLDASTKPVLLLCSLCFGMLFFITLGHARSGLYRTFTKPV